MTRTPYSKTVPLLLLLAACQTRGCLFSCRDEASISAEPTGAPRRTLKSPRLRAAQPAAPITAGADAAVARPHSAQLSATDSIAITSALESAGSEPFFAAPPGPEAPAGPDDAAVTSAAAGEHNASDAGALTPSASVDAAVEPTRSAEASQDAGSEPVDQARAAAVLPFEEQKRRATEAFQAAFGIGRGSTGVGIGPGTTGEGSGSGYTGVGIGQGSTGTGSGRGATGEGSGTGWTGYGSGRGDTIIGSGEGATAFGSGRGYTDIGSGSGSTGFGSGAGSTGFGSGSGSTDFGLTPFGARAKQRTAEASATRE